MQNFMKMKFSPNGEITLSFTDEGKSCHCANFYAANMSINAIRENKILVKISEFTVNQLISNQFSFAISVLTYIYHVKEKQCLS